MTQYTEEKTELETLLAALQPYQLLFQPYPASEDENVIAITLNKEQTSLVIVISESLKLEIQENWSGLDLKYQNVIKSKLKDSNKAFNVSQQIEEQIIKALINEKKVEDRKGFLQAFRDFLDQLPEVSKEFQDCICELAALQLDEIDIDSLDEKDPNFTKLQDINKKISNNLKAYHQKAQPDFEPMDQQNEGLIGRPKFLDDYPKQGKKLERLFKILQGLEVGPQSLKVISTSLGISNDKLATYFQTVKSTVNNSDEKEDPFCDISLRLPQQKRITIEEENCKTLEQVIEELNLINHKDEMKIEIRTAVEKLEKYYQDVKEWKEKELSEWSQQYKGHLDKKGSEELLKAMAVLERANELATGGQRLRYTQKVAILVLMKNSEIGHISQINTGEGKTTIVAFVLALRVMQGFKGHAITSNEVLAAEGAKNKELFCNLLGITVAHNNLETDESVKGARACYSKDIVYGSMSNFQFDWLRDSFERLNTMNGLDFGKVWVMLDEIDSLLIDQGGNIAKLSGPFPGMESLRYVYINIWIALEKCESEVEKEILETLQRKASEFNAKLSKNLQAKYPNLLKKSKEEDSLFLSYLEDFEASSIKILNHLQLSAENPDKQKACLEELEKMKDLNAEAYEEFEDKLRAEYLGKVQERMKTMKNKLIPEEIIEKRLREYVNQNLEGWIKCAFSAKYQFNLNVEYKIVMNKEKERMIVPVDNQNTGVSLQNTILSNGLHQFLQLKHNLHLTYESLTSSYISNLCYVKKYDSRISGVTGTLGSDAERDLLGEVFNLEFSIIPTYKTKIFQEFPGQIATDEEFYHKVAEAALSEVARKRASLIICTSIRDVEEIKREIKKRAALAGLEPRRIETYYDELEASVTESELDSGDIVIATNIAGRGTDFKTSAGLEENKGLHIIIGFLPCNKRVQDQAFGRTSRQGKSGTGQIIASMSGVVEVLGMELKEVESLDFETILGFRDLGESARVAEIKKSKVKELLYKDKLFEKFSEICGQLKDKHKDCKWSYVLSDLKERWAFWLYKQEEKIKIYIKQGRKEDVDQVVEKEFSEFEQLTAEIRKGRIMHNPYYGICLAERYLEAGDSQSRAFAKDELNNALNIGNNSNLLYSAHMKLFEIAIEDGGQVLERYKKAVASIFFFSVEKDESYKTTALHHLKKAREGLMIEMKYLSSLMEDEGTGSFSSKFESILTTTSSENLEEEGETAVTEKSQTEIPNKEEEGVNPFVKHLQARQTVLGVYFGNIESLIQQMETLKDGIIIDTKISGYLSKLSPNVEHEKELKKAITDSEVDELEYVGMNSIMQLREVHDVHEEVITAAQCQIGAGIAALAVTIPFPFLLPVNGPIAGALISEGITDIVMALIDQGQDQFNKTDFIKGKVMSYGVSLATMGLGALMSSSKILMKAMNACKSLANKLRTVNGPFAKVCNKMANQLDKLANYLELSLKKLEMAKKGVDAQKEMLAGIHKEASAAEKLGDTAKYDKLMKQFNQLDKLKKTADVAKATHLQKIMNVAKTSSIGALKETAISVITEKIQTATLNQILSNLQPYLQKEVKDAVEKRVNAKDISQFPKIALEEQLQKTFETDLSEDVENVVEKASLGVLKHLSSMKLALLAYETVLAGVEIKDCADEICDKFLSGLKTFEKKKKADPQASESDVKAILNDLSVQIADIMYQKIFSITEKVASTLPKTLYRGYRRRQEKKAEKERVDSMKKRIEDVNASEKSAKSEKTACAHNAVATSLGIDDEHLAHSSGLGMSTQGATKEDVHALYTKIGVATTECNAQDAVQQLGKNNSDRGIVCLRKADGGLGHVVPVTLENGQLMVTEKGKKMSLEAYRSANNYTADSTVIVPHDVSTEKIADGSLARMANHNRIAKAAHPIDFVGEGQGEKFGAPKYYKNHKSQGQPPSESECPKSYDVSNPDELEQLYFRTLRLDEDPIWGLHPLGDDQSFKAGAHVAKGGQEASPFISTSQDIKITEKWTKNTNQKIREILQDPENRKNVEILKNPKHPKHAELLKKPEVLKKAQILEKLLDLKNRKNLGGLENPVEIAVISTKGLKKIDLNDPEVRKRELLEADYERERNGKTLPKERVATDAINSQEALIQGSVPPSHVLLSFKEGKEVTFEFDGETHTQHKFMNVNPSSVIQSNINHLNNEGPRTSDFQDDE